MVRIQDMHSLLLTLTNLRADKAPVKCYGGVLGMMENPAALHH